MGRLRHLVWYLRGSVMSRNAWRRHQKLIRTLNRNLEKLK